MLIIFSFVSAFLLFLATSFAAVHGFQYGSVDGDNSALGYRFYDAEESHLSGKRDAGKNVMWIGPRLGRRKRSEEENNVGNVSEKNGKAVLEMLQESPWAFVALKGGKRRTVNFIPRLGRESEEEYGDAGAEPGFGKSASRSGSQLAGPFGGGNNFTPRLGRYANLFNNRDHV